MSVWYHLDVTIMGDRSDLARFLNLDKEDVWCSEVKLSFGGKNAPGMRFRKVVEKNPDLVFLVRQTIECDTVQWFLLGHDKDSGADQFVMVEDSGECVVEINKAILEDYTKAHPTLPAKHFARQGGFENFRWEMFFTYERAAQYLRQADKYSEMVSPMSAEDSHDDAHPGMAEE